MPSLTRQDDVFVLDLGDTENRFHPDWVSGVSKALDEVSAADGPRALVTTATGKFWSNGLDLEWMGANQSQIQDNVDSVHELFAKTLELDVPTVAAIQGHCFAAGAMLALAHDQRVMRSDRGFFCLPEVDIQIPFTPGMNALIVQRLSTKAAFEAMTTGRRYGGEDAAAAGIVDEALPEDELLPRAIELAAAQAGKPAATLGTIKQRLHAATLETLRDRAANSLG
jgi:enoyl-CoA hydratase/carnithine racemase